VNTVLNLRVLLNAAGFLSGCPIDCSSWRAQLSEYRTRFSTLPQTAPKLVEPGLCIYDPQWEGGPVPFPSCSTTRNCTVEAL
jgi:hypothetical protein